MRVRQRNPKARNARHIVPKIYTSITINIVYQKRKKKEKKKEKKKKLISLILCVSKHMCVCRCVHGGSFVHAHIHIHKMKFLCTNVFAKYVMRPKTYNDMLNKRK